MTNNTIKFKETTHDCIIFNSQGTLGIHSTLGALEVSTVSTSRWVEVSASTIGVQISICPWLRARSNNLGLKYSEVIEWMAHEKRIQLDGYRF